MRMWYAILVIDLACLAGEIFTQAIWADVVFITFNVFYVERLSRSGK